ncbi:Chemotaxis protein CheY [Magnetospirillum sp. XM-1]|uniref:response regulator n=1 Tax=Magnetospirillum sp. XM-1 TaxID=1663591 RepID=UPI00073DEB84|nr:response regulator [Magnetospirillum sp. XM-1]CUW41615.1 Chemotaxis protein CheY [Magnetospirillum sp. XM-1]
MSPSAVSVLVVDDSGVARKRLASLLEEFGYGVVGFAADGAEAVAMFQSLRPDLVTMDITMPGMDGIAATSQIMEAHPSAVIVVVSSHGQESMVLDALDAGAKDYIVKTVEKEALRTALRKVVARHIPNPRGSA